MLHTSISSLALSCAALSLGVTAQQPRPPQRAHQQVWAIDGTAALVRVREGGTAAVSRDGGANWTALTNPDPRLHLRLGDFDPLRDSPVVPPALADDGTCRLFLVQMASPIIPEHTAALARLGAEVESYLPSQTYVVRMDRGAAARLRTRGWVRWIGAYHPAYRLDPELARDLCQGTLAGTARYNVLAVDHIRDDGVLEATITAAGGRVDMSAKGGGLVVATLSPGQLGRLSHDDTVLWIDRWAPYEADMDNARAQSGAATLHALPSPIDGKGMRVHSFDLGFYTTHPEFAARPPYREAPIVVLGTGTDSHGTSVIGILAAQGLNAKARGMMPFAQLLVTGYSQAINNRYDLARILRDPSGPYRALTTTSSVSTTRTLNYTSVSAATDRWVFDFDFFYTQSQSNAGNRNSRPEAWAKNTASVAGFDHFDNPDPTDDRVASGTSRGPASDGRIGVTFAGYYDSIYTTTASSTYANFCCTSGATPMVCGLAGLVIEQFTDGRFGYPSAGWQNRFDVQPHFTTTKALVMATTRPLAFDHANRYEQGWGFPNVEDAYTLSDRILVLDEEDLLRQGDARTYWVFAPGGEQLRACMTYADPPANPSATVHRVNSLDLQVVAPDGTAYWGNHGLITGPFSTPGGEANDRDTEEAVWLPAAARGLYAVTVRAPALRLDSHPASEPLDSSFALAVRGVAGGRDRSGMTLDLDSSGPGQLTVTPGSVPAGGWSTGYTVFSASTARQPSLGSFLGVELDALAQAILSQVPAAGNVFAFTNGGGAAYPNAPFAFPAPVATALQGLTFDATVLLLDSQGNAVAVSNVDRVTVQ